jgi:PAS domain S-box-containing protein
MSRDKRMQRDMKPGEAGFSAQTVAAEALLKQKAYFEHLFYSIPAALVLLDNNDCIEDFNEAFGELFQYVLEEVKGQPINELIVPSHLKKEADSATKNVGIGETIYFESVRKRKDDTLVEVAITGRPIIAKTGQLAVLGIYQNISYRKETEKKLKENEARMRSISESANDAIVMLDPFGNVSFWNNAAEKIFGYIRDEVMGKNFHTLILPEHLYKDFEHGFEYFKKTGEGRAVGKTLELKGLHKNGDVIAIELSLSSLLLDNQWHSVGIMRDVTERKRLFEELRLNEIRLHELNATKDKFFSIIAHDLKNPFSGLIGFSNLLVEKMQEKDYDGIERYAEIILESSQRAMSLLENLLEWSQAHTGKIEFNPEYVVMQSLAQKEAALLFDAAKEKSVHITIQIPNSHIAYADMNMIGTVIRNLISNAVKFSHPGDVVLVSTKTEDEKLIFYVKDEGTGIPDNRLAKLFKIDQGFSLPGTYKEKGTGLGLILCKEFIERHGGDIWAESEEGKGSVFYFSLNTTPI